MSGGAGATGPLARFYEVTTGTDDLVTVALVERPLADAQITDGTLMGPASVVTTRAVLVATDEHGQLVGVPVPPLAATDGHLCFDPSTGGIRTRENRRAAGAFNALVEQANAFGMVNAFVHVERAAAHVNGMLAELGAAPLPPVGVVVGAHVGSRLPGYGHNDGDRWGDTLRPMSGGHYRLSTRTTGVAELSPVAPTGEIHLGPSRYRKPYAGSLAYLRNAAHNPAIIYHEYGHHLCRHTADFRLNAEREPDEQRNGKPGIEEAICDYLAAVLLDSGRPYGWYRADRGARRDLDVERVAGTVDDDDPHAAGAPWAAALWRSRTDLTEAGLLATPHDHDRAVLAALCRVGRAYRADGRHADRSLVWRERRRSRPTTFGRALVRVLERDAGPHAARAAQAIFVARGLVQPATGAVA